MPEQDGVETIRQIRAVAPTIPIIAMSSVGSWGDATPLDNARSVGADRALEKPFAISALLELVDELLSTSPPRAD